MKKFKLILLGLLMFSMLVFAINFRTEKFIDADYTATINTTAIEGTDFDSKVIGLAYSTYASITLYVEGNSALCSKDVIFKFAGYDSLREMWDTLAYVEIAVTANGNIPTQKTFPLAPDVTKIKLLSVQNQETVAGYTVDVNASIFIKELL